MKGYFYKEWSRIMPATAIIMGIDVFMAIKSIIFAADGSSLSLNLALPLISMVFYISYAEDKKSLWESSSKAFPVSATKRVSVRFIFLFAVVLVAWIINDVFHSMSHTAEWIRHESENEVFFEFMLKECYSVGDISRDIVWFSLFLIGCCTSVSMCYFSKTQVGLTFAIFPPLVGFFAILLIQTAAVLSDRDKLFEKICVPNIAFCFLAASVIIYLACYFLCVAKETVVEKNIIKKTAVTAAVLSVCGLILIGSCVYSLEAMGAFEKIPEEDRFNVNQNQISNSEKYEADRKAEDAIIRPVVLSLIDDMCGETLIDKTNTEVQKFFEENGYGEYLEYNTEDDLLVISCTTYINSTRPDYPDIVSFYAKVLRGIIKTDNYKEKLVEIKRNFAIGASEEHVLEMMKSYGLCPISVIEGIDGERYYRTYHIDLEIFDENEGTGWFHSIYLEITDGKVYDVRINNS